MSLFPSNKPYLSVDSKKMAPIFASFLIGVIKYPPSVSDLLAEAPILQVGLLPFFARLFARFKKFFSLPASSFTKAILAPFAERRGFLREI